MWKYLLKVCFTGYELSIAPPPFSIFDPKEFASSYSEELITRSSSYRFDSGIIGYISKSRIWNSYESILSIVYELFWFFSLQIIRERLPDYPTRNGIVWNSAPGALLTLPTFSDSSIKLPFLLDLHNKEPAHNYTAIIFVQIGIALTPNTALYRLVKSITKSQYVARVSIQNSQNINWY